MRLILGSVLIAVLIVLLSLCVGMWLGPEPR